MQTLNGNMVTKPHTPPAQGREDHQPPVGKITVTDSVVRTPLERVQWLRSVLCGCLLR